jgi:hypothetical protein
MVIDGKVLENEKRRRTENKNLPPEKNSKLSAPYPSTPHPSFKQFWIRPWITQMQSHASCSYN